MKYAEFIGLPGAGKTTLARRLKERLVAAGIRPYDINQIAADGYAHWSAMPRSKRIKRWIRRPVWSWRECRRRRRVCYGDRFVAWLKFCERYPETAELVAARWSGANDTELRIARHLSSLAANYEAALRTLSSTDVLIADDGFWHFQSAIEALRGGTSEGERILARIEGTPLPDLVVWPRVDPELAAQRMCGRGRFTPALDDLNHEERLVHLRRRDAYCRNLAHALDGHTHVVAIDNAHGFEDAATCLDEAVSRLLRCEVEPAQSSREVTT